MSPQLKLFSLLFISAFSCVFAACSAEVKSDRFIIASANLDGSNYKIIQKDATHNMTHPRVSPDGKRVAFTKYFHKNFQGLCLEDDGYFDTEIVICDIDGANAKTIVPHKPGVMNANCSWLGNDRIYFIHFKPPQPTQIVILDVGKKETKVLPTKKNLMPSDPHIVGTTFVYATVDPTNKNPNSIWTSMTDGSNVKQLTHPQFNQKVDGKFNLGDYDPRLSPNAKQVAFMRYFGKDDWRMFVIDRFDLDSKEKEVQTHLPGAWAVPDWTPDGKQLVAFRIDKNDLKASGIWIMNPDGSAASKIQLPPQYFIHNPNTYFDSVKNQARVIYGGKFNPGL
ncbi:MAG: hypothetical protein SFY67_07550 [Candidatus Melainabacteria bacterium]|nr:hypothetical protein [Candidatus Melainabacteria bacterium]